MSAPPIPMVFDGEAFQVLPGFLRVANSHYGAGEVVSMARHEERSSASHRQFFAVVRDVWASLPEHLAERFASDVHLRKYALIKAGFHEQRIHVCKFKTEARRLAAAIRPDDEFALILTEGTVVTVYTAKSQKQGSMDRAEFQASKDGVFRILGEMIGVDPTTISRQQGSGEGAEHRAGTRAAA